MESSSGIPPDELLAIHVMDWVDRRFTDPGLCLADAGRRFGVNERTIRRALDAYGTSWRTLLHERRLQEAERLLEETPYMLKAVARLCGYDSLPAFIVFFRRYRKLTPAEWRAAKGGRRRAGGPTGAARRPAERARAREAGVRGPTPWRMGPTMSDQAVLDQEIEDARARLADRYGRRRGFSIEELSEEAFGPRGSGRRRRAKA